MQPNLTYWHIETWPLHVVLRIFESILMAYMYYYLMMIGWPKQIIQKVNIKTHDTFGGLNYCSKAEGSYYKRNYVQPKFGEESIFLIYICICLFVKSDLMPKLSSTYYLQEGCYHIYLPI